MRYEVQKLKRFGFFISYGMFDTAEAAETLVNELRALSPHEVYTIIPVNTSGAGLEVPQRKAAAA